MAQPVLMNRQFLHKNECILKEKERISSVIDNF